MSPAILPPTFLRSAPLLAALLALAGGGCGRSVEVSLTLVEPCDQKNQALNGVASYALSSSGAEGADDPVAFNLAQGPQPLLIPLGTNIITVEAFREDVSESGAASTTPQSIGRTMPLLVDANTQAITANVLTGKINTFGRTSDADGTCTAMTADAPIKGRHGHTATFVPVLNQVLIVGGAVWVEAGGVLEERILDSAELWDPATGELTKIDDASARAYHTATAMPDGKVLVAGGIGVVAGRFTTLVSGAVFDPETKTFSSISLKQPRAHHTATLMADVGIIALVGGCVGDEPADGCLPGAAAAGPDGPSTNLTVSVETFDINQSVTTEAVAQGLLVGRAFHSASVIGQGLGQVLVIAGGANNTGTICELEFFRQEGAGLTRVEAPQAAPFPTGRCPARHAAVSLDAGSLLVTGGVTQAPDGVPGGSGSSELFFVSAAGVNANAVNALVGRAGHQAIKLDNGNVLLIGGTVPDGSAAAERIVQQGTSVVSNPVVGLLASRDRMSATLLPNNQVFVSGGHSTTQPFTTVANTEIYFGE